MKSKLNTLETKRKPKDWKRIWARIGVILLILLGVFAISFVTGYLFYKNNKYIPILEKKPTTKVQTDNTSESTTNSTVTEAN